MSDLRSRMIRLAYTLPRGSRERKALLNVLASSREMFVLHFLVPKGPKGRKIQEEATRIIGKKYFESKVKYDSEQDKVFFAIPDEQEAIRLWRATERKLGIKIDMTPEDY